MSYKEIYGGGWPYDEYSSGPPSEARHARDILTFRRPRSSPLFQRIAAWLNWVLYLRLGLMRYGSAKPIVARQELAKLKAIPTGAGNILVGPHPGPLDPNLMFYLATKAHEEPLAFLVAEEMYYGGTFLRRAALSQLGAMPVARGNKNPEAIRCMTEHLANGGWGGIFPEGELYFSREVMPMEYGALRIATEAALEIQHDAERSGGTNISLRPILVTPFAYAYFFADPPMTLRRVVSALEELESRAEVFGEPRKGDVVGRLRAVADALLEHKAREYGIPSPEWQHPDRFVRAKKLRDAALERLETQYIGGVQEGFVRRRALKVRMVIYARLAQSQLSDAEREELQRDLQQTREIVLTVPFTRAYLNKYGDLEMWVEYLRRFRRVLQMASRDLGPQDVVFKILAPIDMHAVARHYRSLPSEDARLEYLFQKTEELRGTIQAGVNEICAAHPTRRISAA